MQKNELMKEMTLVADKLRGSRLIGLSEMEPMVKKIMDKVSLSTVEETMLLIAMVDRQCSGKASSISDLSDYFKCSAMEVMALAPAVRSLLRNGYIYANDPMTTDITDAEFHLCASVLDSIVEGDAIRTIPQTDAKDFDQFVFCYTIYRVAKKGIGMKGLTSLTQQLEEEHAQLPLVNEMRGQVEDAASRALFYVLCRNFCEGKECLLKHLIRCIYSDSVALGAIARKDIMSEEHPLVKCDLVRVAESEIYEFRKNGDYALKLGEKGLKTLFGEAAEGYLTPCDCADRFEFVRRVIDLWSELPNDPDRRHFKHFYTEIERLEQGNSHLRFIANILRQVSDTDDRLLFYRVCDSALEGKPLCVGGLRRTYQPSKQTTAKRELKENKHILQRQALVELGPANFFGDSTLTLTEKGKGLFFEEDIDLFEGKSSDKNLIACDTITQKNLFFEPSLERQLSTIRDTLSEDKLQALRKRLKENHLPTGIAILLYGLPGTGKTESVMQMARATGRSIMHVDISQTKSHWFGDSEKIIKEVFTTYRKLCEKSKVAPILLFNEADAVLSKRKDTDQSNVAQTENAIQNIILEEMERLDGIMVATTNLSDNLDKAFERRFLFKVHFGKPTTESKAQIWKDKMPRLSTADATRLATEFDFSGGEIDNIVRKVVVEEIVRGNTPEFQHLLTLCKEEKLNSRQRKIGF